MTDWLNRVPGTAREQGSAIALALDSMRTSTLALLQPLDEATVERQLDPLMSPLVWDLAHVGNFEELWLVRTLTGRPARRPHLDALYNPMDNPRWVRGSLPLLALPEALEYLESVRRDALEVLAEADLDRGSPLLAQGFVYRMVLQHEAQHQETMLQALDLQGDGAPYPPARPCRGERLALVDDEERVAVPAGEFRLGSGRARHCYDNERPQHRVWLPTYLLERYPVTVRRWAAFVDAGGYRKPELWSAEGLHWLRTSGHRAPQGWVRDGRDGWRVRRFNHVVPLDPREPVQHVSFWEAEAFARWCGASLPTEAQWEKAAAWDPASGESRCYPWGDGPQDPAQMWLRANVGRCLWGPAPVGSYPQGASALGVEQLLGDVYQWTSSSFRPYPGFQAFPYPEYSEDFFGERYRVLRGASWAIPPVIARNTYRNWDLPERRQLFAGVRLAWDAS